MASELSDVAKQRMIDLDQSGALPEQDRALGVRLGILPARRIPPLRQPLAPSQAPQKVLPASKPEAPLTAPPVAATTPPLVAPAESAAIEGRQPGETRRHYADTVAAERRAKGEPPWKVEWVANARRLKAKNLISDPHLDTMPDADFVKVMEYSETQKQEPRFQQRLQQVRGQLDELEALQMAESVSADLFPLLTSKNVGLRGLLSMARSTVEHWLGTAPPAYQDMTLKKAVESTRKVLDLAKQRGDIDQVLADIPAAAQAMKTPGAPTVQTFAAVLAYLHASALRKGASPTSTAGLRSQDIKFANDLFDPITFVTNPNLLRERLVGLQAGFIQPARANVEKYLRLRGINPHTLQPLTGHLFGETEREDVPQQSIQEMMQEDAGEGGSE
jgi:hypothetical protein